jgi:hypothetical protein
MTLRDICIICPILVFAGTFVKMAQHALGLRSGQRDAIMACRSSEGRTLDGRVLTSEYDFCRFTVTGSAAP